MKSKYLSFALFLFVCGLSMAEGPCAKDRETLCSGIEPGEGRIRQCLKENESKLSEGCKEAQKMAKSQMKEMRAACHEDAEKLCPGMKKKELRECLRSHKDKLSPACMKEKQNMREKRRKAKEKA